MPDRLAARAAGVAREMKRRALACGALLLLSACGSTPVVYGPGVLVLPGTGKSFDEFRFDDQDCRGYAQTQLTDQQDSAGLLQQRYDRAFVQCMYAMGHKIPVSARYSQSPESAQSAGVTAPPPPPPPGPPPAEAPPDYRAK
jgi:hypothetical protein